jgi:hypothetical protein
VYVCAVLCMCSTLVASTASGTAAISVVSQLCYSGVIVVLQWCKSGVARTLVARTASGTAAISNSSIASSRGCLCGDGDCDGNGGGGGDCNGD